jgi:hypothetical protein
MRILFNRRSNLVRFVQEITIPGLHVGGDQNNSTNGLMRVVLALVQQSTYLRVFKSVSLFSVAFLSGYNQFATSTYDFLAAPSML